MKELLTYVAQNLVEHPEQVSVTEVEGDGETVLELRVAPEDMGKVIGRQGRIAKETEKCLSFRKKRTVLIRKICRRPGEQRFFSLQAQIGTV